MELLLPLVCDTTVTMEISSLAALSLGLVYGGSCDGEITSTILQTLMERDDEQLKDPFAKLMGVGLSLLFVGKQDAAEAPLETLKAIENPLAKQIEVMLEICAFAGKFCLPKLAAMSLRFKRCCIYVTSTLTLKRKSIHIKRLLLLELQ
jgi:26S proteasome regulatory subunit N1